MKKILTFLIISLLVCQSVVVLAIDKNNNKYNSATANNMITKSGSISGISIEDN